MSNVTPNSPEHPPRRRMFASGRIPARAARGPVTHLTARIDSAALRIPSTVIPQSDVEAFVIAVEKAAEKRAAMLQAAA